MLHNVFSSHIFNINRSMKKNNKTCYCNRRWCIFNYTNTQVLTILLFSKKQVDNYKLIKFWNCVVKSTFFRTEHDLKSSYISVSCIPRYTPDKLLPSKKGFDIKVTSTLNLMNWAFCITYLHMVLNNVEKFDWNCINGLYTVQMNEWMDKQMNEWINEWTKNKWIN